MLFLSFLSFLRAPAWFCLPGWTLQSKRPWCRRRRLDDDLAPDASLHRSKSGRRVPGDLRRRPGDLVREVTATRVPFSVWRFLPDLTKQCGATLAVSVLGRVCHKQYGHRLHHDSTQRRTNALSGELHQPDGLPCQACCLCLDGARGMLRRASAGFWIAARQCPRVDEIRDDDDPMRLRERDSAPSLGCLRLAQYGRFPGRSREPTNRPVRRWLSSIRFRR